MKRYNALRILQSVILSGFAVVALSFGHLTFSQQSMAGMEGMTEGTGSSVRCQILCTTAIKTDTQGVLTRVEDDNKDPQSMVILLGEISLLLLAACFTVKRLHLLSSWRPPDRILLCGHFADGL